MRLVHFYHRHGLHRLAGHTDFKFFELAVWFHTLAQALIWIFVPILLVQTGYSVTEVLVYYLIFNLIDVPLNFPAANLVRKIGARKVVIIATIAIIAFFLVLGVLPPGQWFLLVVLAVLSAVYDACFWVAHMYLFIEINRQGLDAGRSVGAIEGVRKFGNIVGPLVGAALLILLGKPSLIIVSVILFACSIVPLFKMRHTRDVPTEKRASFREFFSEKVEWRDYASTALWGIHNETDSILWPLFIFMAFGNLGSVAAVPVIISITTAVFSYVAGRMTKRHAFTMISVGSALMACMWVLRIAFGNAILLYATVFLVGFFSLLVAIPIDGSITSRALEKGSLEASTYHNVMAMLLRVPLYLFLLLFVNVFRTSFIMAAMSLFLILAVSFLYYQQTKRSRR
jgi:MFS family permease